jgi:4-amino-4-deoxy-L-arabinose transferase-like glycosyltransferase
VSQGQNRQDTDAFAETQVIRAIPAQGPPPQESPSSNGKQSAKPQGANAKPEGVKPEGARPQGPQSASDDDVDPLARTESVAARIPLKSGTTQVSPGTPVTPPKPSTAEGGGDAEKPQGLSVERESSRAAKAQPAEAESSRDQPSLFQEHAPSTSRPASSHRRSTQPKQSDPAQHSLFRPQEPSPAEKLEAEWPSLFRPEPPSASSSRSASPAAAEEVDELEEPLPRIPPFQPQAQPPIAEILGRPDEADPEATQRRSRPRVSGNFDFAAETQVANPRRPSIPVPPEFLSAARFRTDGASPGLGTPPAPAPASAEPSDGPGPGMRARPQQDEGALDAAAFTVVPPPAPAKTPASTPGTPAKPDKPEKPDDGGFSSGPPKWQDHVPFDETGVLLRPEALRHHAMQAETELMSVIKIDAGDDGSEAAKAQRPGFWTGAWPRRGLLAVIMLLQAILTLRNNNSAFEDEALYLFSGHLELGHMLYGTSLYTNFWSYFSGAPTLYPVLGAIADQIGGLFAARLLSLAFLLGTTGLLYLLSRRIFGTRAALCAAALFSCSEAAVFVGGLATYDAPALFLLALAAWIVVRFASWNWPVYLLAVFPAALAVGTKYAALMFVPVIIVLALMTAAPYAGKLALLRPVALTIGFAFVIWAMLKIAGTAALQGVETTTTARAQGTNSVMSVVQMGGEWGGVVFAASVVGGVFLVLMPRTHGHRSLPAARWQRLVLALLMAGTALLPVAYQAHLHTLTSLQKHVGFGLFFAAPLAGYGLVRMVGPHFHRVQLGIGVMVLTFALGMGQSLSLFHGWPNSNTMVSELVKYQKPGGHYLVEADEVPIYALRGDPDAEPTQFTDTFFFAYTTSKGQALTGIPAYQAAIAAGYFQTVVYDGLDNPPVDQAIAAAMYRATYYQLVATIPAPDSYGTGYYYFWVRK